LLDKCKDSQLDDLDLESDDDRDLVGNAATATTAVVTSSASASGLSSSKRFPSASTVDAMETAELAEVPAEGVGQNQQASMEWTGTNTDLPACDNLDNIGPEPTPGDDSDKDHNFGNTLLLFCFVNAWSIVLVRSFIFCPKIFFCMHINLRLQEARLCCRVINEEGASCRAIEQRQVCIP
jgi:hypothetical protein